MRFYGVILAPIFPVEKTETLVCILGFTIIYFGADGSHRLIKCGALVNCCVLIDSLSNAFSPEIGDTNFSFA